MNIYVARAGGVMVVSRMLGISPSAVSRWKLIPAERAAQIEHLTNGALTIQEMRPDLFPKKG